MFLIFYSYVWIYYKFCLVPFVTDDSTSCSIHIYPISNYSSFTKYTYTQTKSKSYTDNYTLKIYQHINKNITPKHKSIVTIHYPKHKQLLNLNNYVTTNFYNFYVLSDITSLTLVTTTINLKLLNLIHIIIIFKIHSP